uniref:NADH-ubiquinone oxidoreductase chain 3 n=2 Tax=Tetriginae TaxID=1636980 RepID=B6CZ28_9ORTH|nr:NADH dehydrogenase subunit 3 [Alulatettix yunnanensis]YP_006665863.1 NADH dehydrogenase subunit 3 [Tetrix japonica]ACC62209.1 NADH dehydrogenase subunit 3 [Tetrix japonica]AEZ00770.1 NADH dehydrogenase subunit 3 [Alulatettix yunnanensis]AFA36675.1 NADH dehydrogenase subunit 3 [Tetrix japonica]
MISMMTITFLISLILPMIMMMLSMMISKKTISDREKSSPFECGFNPKTHARLPFSIQFFLISMLFLIFDVEIALIIPLIPIMKTSSIKFWWISTSAFIIILLVGIYYEWNQGMLKWAT